MDCPDVWSSLLAIGMAGIMEVMEAMATTRIGIGTAMATITTEVGIEADNRTGGEPKACVLAMNLQQQKKPLMMPSRCYLRIGPKMNVFETRSSPGILSWHCLANYGMILG